MTEPPAATALIGKVSEFCPDTEHISPYLERLSLFLKVNKITGDSEVPAILTIVGPKIYSLLRDLHAPTLPEECTKDEIFEKLKGHLNPKSLVIAERYCFHQRSQHSDESSNSRNLLGQDWLRHIIIRLNWTTISTIHAEHSVKQLCQKYDTVFKKVGFIKPYKASLIIQAKAKPKFRKARPVPYSIKEDVGKQLDQLEADGVLTRVDYSEWATPLVVVPKPNGKIRLCGDFKVTLNPVMDIKQYPLSKPQDLFATLSGGQQFSKIDVRQAYLQLRLEKSPKNWWL